MNWLAYYTILDEAKASSGWERDKTDWLVANIVYHLRLAFLGTEAAGNVKEYLMRFERAPNDPPPAPTVKELTKAVGDKLIAWAKLQPGTRDLRGQKPC